MDEQELAHLAGSLLVSPEAFEFADREGGRVHVWDEPFGGGFNRVRAGLKPPEGREFRDIAVEHGTVRVSLSGPIQRLKVAVQPWPRRRLVAFAEDGVWD